MADEDFTPIEIPTIVADAAQPFAELEPDDQVALLGQLFTDEMSDEDVTSIQADIAAEILLLNEERTPENVDRMKSLTTYLDVVEAEMANREEASAELNAAADAIAGRFDSEGAEGDEGAPTGDAEGDPEGEMGAGSDDEDEDGESDGDGEAASPADPVASVPEAAAVKPSGSGLAARLAARAQSQPTRVESGQPTTAAAALVDAPAGGSAGTELALELLGVTTGAMRATGAARTTWADVGEGEDLTLDQLAEIFWGKRKQLHNRMGHGVKDDRITLASTTVDWADERMLTEDARTNFGVFTSLKHDVQTIVASGGSCAPAAPRYDIFRLAEPQSPVEDAIPVLGAPRGTIRFVVPPDFSEMRSGIGVTTDAEDAAGYGSGSGEATPKPCVHVDCPAIVEAVVTTVSQCIEFGNLTFETFPEFVAARLADLAVNFASVKEVFYLDGIDAASVTQTATAAYGVSRSVPQHVATVAHNYRKRQNMDVDATLDWLAADWLAVAHQVDKRNDFSEGANLNPSVSEVTAEYAAFGLNVVWYYDSATGEGQAFTDLAVDEDPSADFPTTAVWYLFAPGTFVRLDAGTLDLGIVRDSVLNRTNDLQIFAEQWIQIVQLGIESIKGETTDLCPSGGAPAAVAVLSCAAGS